MSSFVVRKPTMYDDHHDVRAMFPLLSATPAAAVPAICYRAGCSTMLLPGL